MAWLTIDTAPRDGSAILYKWMEHVVSTCVWLGDGWWDVRAEEEVFPQEWALVV